MLCRHDLIKKYYSSAKNKAFSDFLRFGKSLNIPYQSISTLSEFYLWQTQLDDRVRPTHRENHGKVSPWAKKPPYTFHPGVERYCRCWPEAVIASFPSGIEQFIKMDDIKTWPDLPISAKFSKVALASRSKPSNRKEVSIYDQYGGEWRPHIDRRH